MEASDLFDTVEPVHTKPPVYDGPTPLDGIIAFEQGELDEDELVELFQQLIDLGVVWHLQGVYGRIASGLLEQGVVFLPNDCEREGATCLRPTDR